MSSDNPLGADPREHIVPSSAGRSMPSMDRSRGSRSRAVPPPEQPDSPEEITLARRVPRKDSAAETPDYPSVQGGQTRPRAQGRARVIEKKRGRGPILALAGLLVCGLIVGGGFLAYPHVAPLFAGQPQSGTASGTQPETLASGNQSGAENIGKGTEIKPSASLADLKVDASAVEGVAAEAYVESSTAWLHEDYSKGTVAWDTEGSVVGVSNDKSIIAIQKPPVEGAQTMIIGADLRTGEERWRFIGAQDGHTCLGTQEGLAYCTSNGRTGKTVFTIDLLNGSRKDLAVIQGDAVMYDFLGVQDHQTFWDVDLPDGDGEGDRHALAAVKEGQIAWSVEIELGTECRLLDGAIGCVVRTKDGPPVSETNTNGFQTEVIAILNAKTGAKISEVQDMYSGHPIWFRDGFLLNRAVPTGQEGSLTEFVPTVWNLYGKEVRILDIKTIIEPKRFPEELLLPVDKVEKLNRVWAVNSVGDPILDARENRTFPSGGIFVSGTETALGPIPEFKVLASRSGEVLALETMVNDWDTVMLFRKDGTQITSIEGSRMIVEGGIIISQNRSRDNSKLLILAPAQ